jgi:hypothetical protein
MRRALFSAFGSHERIVANYHLVVEFTQHVMAKSRSKGHRAFAIWRS